MWSGPRVAHIISIFYLLVLFTPFVSCAIEISIRGRAQAQSNVTIAWSRLPSDPPISSVAKVKTDELNGPLTSDRFPIPNPGELSGTLDVFFNRAGIFRVLAYGDDPNAASVASSDVFGVLPPAGLSSAGSNPATTTSTTLPSTTSSPSVSVLPSKSPNSASAASNKTPIIISSVIGGVFLLFFIGLLVYLIQCRRVLRQRKAEAYAAEKSQWITPFFSRSSRPAHSPRNDSDRSFPNDVEKQPDFAASVRPAHMIQPISNGYPFKNRRITATTLGSIGTEISSIRFNPLTGRQIEMEARINKLNAKLEQLQARAASDPSAQSDSAVKAATLKGLIEQLVKLKESPYAMGLTDEVPPGWR